MAKKIEVQIVGDASSLQRALSGATSGTSKFGGALGALAKTGVLAAGAAGIGAVAITLRQGIKEYTESAKVAAQTNAVIKSTGGIANVTAKQVDSLATSMMRKSGVDDEAIATGENMILTFKNIHNEAGKGNDIFNQATQAVLDMDTAMTQGNVTAESMAKTSIRVGKALNDPIAGISALARVGVTFTEGQKDAIKAMVESGDVMGAQKLILKELTSEFGGSAEAIGKTMPKQLNVLKESFNNFAGDLVAKAIPSVQRFVDFLNTRLIPAEGFTAKLKVVWTGASEVTAELWGKIKAAWEGNEQKLFFETDKRIEVVGEEGFKEKLKAATKNATATMWDDVKADARQGWDEFWHDISTGTGSTETAAGIARQFTSTLWAGMVGGLRATGASMNALIREVFIDPFTKTDWGFIGNSSAGRLVAGVRGGVAALGPLMSETMSQMVNTVTQRIPAAFSAALAFGQRIVSGAISGLGDLIGKVRGKLDDILPVIRGVASSAFSAAISIGSSMISGIVSGLSGLVGRVSGAIADGVRGAISRAGGILRGSGDFMFTKHTVGQPMAEGIIEGLAETLAGRLPKNLSSTLLTAMGAAGIDKSATDGGTGIGTSLKGGIDTFLEDKLPDNLAQVLGLAFDEATANFSQAALGVTWTSTPTSAPPPPVALGPSRLADPDAGTIVVNIHQPIGNARQLEDLVVSALSSVRGRGGLGPS